MGSTVRSLRLRITLIERRMALKYWKQALLMSILVDGDASRLYRQLVEQRKGVIDLGGHWHEGFEPARRGYTPLPSV